ncbi:hypothetical protein [Paraburkholderia tropica]|uniref:hypothetical protein n=1 Tax=Paraburkholderia tropica TaxID=92647 RepID=UPI002AB7404E|nr:hypothetical protein [Paraburkholderia tropica]
MSFDEFADQVEESLKTSEGWTEIELADFASPRIGVLIHAYKGGASIEEAARSMLKSPPAVQHFG